jgi:hypothetical protein
MLKNLFNQPEGRSITVQKCTVQGEGDLQAFTNHEGKYGFRDCKGTVMIEPQYEIAGGFSEGLAAVAMNREWGYIDISGKTVIEFKYDAALNFSDGLAAVSENGLWGYIDKTGNTVIPCQFEGAGDFSEGLAPVMTRSSGVDPDVHEIKVMKVHLFCSVSDRSSWGYIDKTGKIVIPAQYRNVGLFSEGRARVQVGDKWGYIDNTGTMVIQPQ